ncbi:PP2C family protein-serine/threonine phosphatase [Pseudoduganella danionis]|uniref:SpoIIE family protein phosphatase n=1 Tax=Pseudoduganella danionis TaxID=1890295 RepID=A0ABW9SNJ7_9BURK|nr:PP2C family serine/threonine-protein phosphatase [Pseudoduganella danionis]MTW31979.1 SpoIIE family protein phosphatase [Pseudoduganella danionis]
MQFSVYQQSHIGARKQNQDRMGYSYTRDALLLVLADGMGGHAHGEVAATVALQTISLLFQQQAAPYVKKPEQFLQQAILAAHETIHRHRQVKGLSETPRTTIVAALVQHNAVVWAHCGDSRLYWLRDGQVLARTRDHSHIENLIAKGLVPAEQRHTHPDRNKLYNCLGADSLPRVELGQGVLQSGDVLLLCSDGLWSMLPDQQIAHSVQHQPIVRAVPAMLQAALAAGGRSCDNVTALAIMWQGSAVADQRGKAADELSSMISTEALSQQEHSSTIAHTAAGQRADLFDDAEIEKAIAEIRGAIAKSSQLLK